jgi:hypothetical protein
MVPLKGAIKRYLDFQSAMAALSKEKLCKNAFFC